MTYEYYTYLHCKPDGVPFYVGKGRNSRAKRFDYGRNEYHRNIVNKYGKKNIKVFIFPCESEAQAFADEMHQIAQLRSEGYKLCNLTDGGEGTSGFVLPESAKKKIGEKAKGRKASLETRIKMGESRKGRKHTEATKLKMSLSCKNSDQYVREKISKSKTGKKRAPFSEEARKNMSLAQIGNKHRLGIKHTEETKAKMKAARQKRKLENA